MAIPASFWDQYDTRFHPTQPPIALGGAGGLSGSNLWRVESASGPLMVRAWPVDGPDPATLSQIHRWLDLICRLDVLPLPIKGRTGATWAEAEGRLWEVTRFCDGAADLGRPPSDSHLASMFAALGIFHVDLATRVVPGRSPGLIARSDEAQRLFSGEFDRFQTILDRSKTAPEAELATSWLDRARRVAPRLVGRLSEASLRSFALQPCIRDVRPDHFLFEGNKLAGLVDFGAMGVDSIATDLARLLGETVGRSPRPRQVALEAYEAERPISPVERAVLDVFEASNALLGGARWVRWHFVEHRRFEPGVVAWGLSRSLARLEDYWDPIA